MQKFSREASAREHRARAGTAPTGRSAASAHGGHGHRLRRTPVAPKAGTGSAEQENPGEATVQVPGGRVRLHGGSTSWDGAAGDLWAVPPARRSLQALGDAAVLTGAGKA
ncbi:cupin domain-containing protein [Peterkaempfera griseoplana]|uniref:hypothetical protein n=1 Tax=Peterkaempfera griseoplana TaxID=66896 RepID=UPI0006E38969|nr:hypothetical protein [Peterkaempfera griseoplana]